MGRIGRCPSPTLVRADVRDELVPAVSDPISPSAALSDPPKGGSSLLGAMVIVARHRGIHLSEAQLRRDHRLGPGEPALEEALRIARASGMRAVTTRLKFRDLMQLGAARPAILLLKNGSAMILLRSEPEAQPPHVVLPDPRARVS